MQAQFDCWAQELEENNQPQDILRCRVAYMEAMREMTDGMKPATKSKMAAKPKKVEKKKRKAMNSMMPFVCISTSTARPSLTWTRCVRSLMQEKLRRRANQRRLRLSDTPIPQVVLLTIRNLPKREPK